MHPLRAVTTRPVRPRFVVGVVLLAAALVVVLAGLGPRSLAFVRQVTAPAPPIALELDPFVSGLDDPTWIGAARDGTGRLLVTERSGTLRAIDGARLVPGPLLDLTDRVKVSAEQGLLAVAIPPGAPADPRLFLTYTTHADEVVLARFRFDAERQAVDPASEQILLRVAQPSTQHNGGQVAFGPDGYLYASIGDGTYLPDEGRVGTGQEPASFRGTIVRLDVGPPGAEAPYAIPPDNPLIDAGAPEVWAYGFRNPWRFSFDRQTGDLWVGDVGEVAIEEIDFEPAGDPGGRNYGWSIKEGSDCFRAFFCDDGGLTPPVAEYRHGEGNCAVVGGFVYRGAAHPELEGWYLYGDYCSGRVWGLPAPGAASVLLASTGTFLSSFGEDADGEILALDVYDGVVRRLVASD